GVGGEDAGGGVRGEDLGVEDRLGRGGGPAAPLLGPQDGGPPAFVELVLPGLALVHHAHHAAGDVGVFVVGPLLDERRHLLVEERFELLLERDVCGRPREVHTKPDTTVRSPLASSNHLWTSRSRRNRRRSATRCARSLVPKHRSTTCAAWPSTTTPASRPRCGARSSTSAGPVCSHPNRRAGWASASSTPWWCR